jgi:hypothetical protein
MWCASTKSVAVQPEKTAATIAALQGAANGWPRGAVFSR